LTRYDPTTPELGELVAFFDYDASSPQRTSIVGREERDGVALTELRFDNGVAGEVAAYVVGEADGRAS